MMYYKNKFLMPKLVFCGYAKKSWKIGMVANFNLILKKILIPFSFKNHKISFIINMFIQFSRPYLGLLCLNISLPLFYINTIHLYLLHFLGARGTCECSNCMISFVISDEFVESKWQHWISVVNNCGFFVIVFVIVPEWLLIF